MVTGFFHTCALLEDATVKCWGRGNTGRLGYGDTSDRGNMPGDMGDNLPRVSLGSGLNPVQLSAGTFHTCARLNDASLKCWGQGSSGMLGYGDVNNRGDGPGEMGDSLATVDLGTGRTAAKIALGGAHTCAILDDATVKCWGFGGNGQLGYGDTTSRGDAPGEMGDNLPTVDLGTGRTALQISPTSFHTCALLDDNSIKCWGSGTAGRLGYGDVLIRGDEPDEMGDNLSRVDLGTGRTAIQVAAKTTHTCALLDDATVKCWGSGSFGQLGYGDTNNRGDEPGEMGDNLPSVDLGTGRTAVQIGTGSSHTCALLDDSSVKCWGAAGLGQLGYGDMIDRGDGPGEMGDNLPSLDLGTGRAAIQLAVGNDHSCVLLDDATVKCWGFELFGRLGYESTANLGDNSGEMGDNLLAVNVGSNITKFPTATPSAAPSESPTGAPSNSPTSLPSTTPTTSAPSSTPTVTTASSVVDPAVIGGVTATTVLLLGAAGYYLHQTRNTFGFLRGTEVKSQDIRA